MKALLKNYTKKFPIVTLTGVRQCGKSTLLRDTFPKYDYVSLEDPDIRAFAATDPRGFLNSCKTPCVLDEIQHVPDLFSYLQTKVDKDNTMGEFLLSGSHNFLLMQSISQSLAGRSAILTLAPFSIAELKAANLLPETPDELMLKGFYPAVYSRNLTSSEYFPSYVSTYIERDVRLLRNIPDANAFLRFVRLCAARSGQILNYSELSNACGVSVPTVRAWISVLIQSYVLFELPPFYNNFSKRLVKSPKLYFYDTGLLCYLLGIETPAQLESHPQRGAIFETLIVSEYQKSCLFAGKAPAGYFWRDSNRNEVDLLVENAGQLQAFEIKSGSTMDQKYLNGLKKFAAVSGIPLKDTFCIYSGERTARGENGSFLSWNDVHYC